MNTSRQSAMVETKLLEIARQAATTHLFSCYHSLSPTAIKVFLACIEQASLVKYKDSFCLGNRPSIRILAKKCALSKTTVQNALQSLTAAGLVAGNLIVVRLDEPTHYFKGDYISDSLKLYAANPTDQAFVATAHNDDAVIESTTMLPAKITVATEVALPTKSIVQHSDSDLIMRYQAGDQEAFATLYQRHFDSLCSYACRYLSESAAHDMVQQIFIDLMEKLKVFRVDGKAKFTTWLYKFTELSLANLRRKNSREMQIVALDNFDVKAVIRLTSPQQQIMPYLLTLDEKQQECVYLHYYEGLTYKDISEQLGIEEKLVRNYLQTARRHIRVLLKKDEQSPDTAKDLDTLYNKFFYAALEKEKRRADLEKNNFILCLFSIKPANRHANVQLDE
ncbi:MAG: sigma-70 family RNA polymerase sigma factor, partial [Acidobacteriota bacterium]